MAAQPKPADYQQSVLHLLDRWTRQRAGLEFCNYGRISSYRSEQRGITRDLHDFRALLEGVSWRSFTQEQWRAAFSAFSGRLSLIEENGQPVRLEYCTGQYFPTEYRKAACAVLARLLWSDAGDNMPDFNGTTTYTIGEGAFVQTLETNSIDGLSAGDWLRKKMLREFGRGVAGRWFN